MTPLSSAVVLTSQGLADLQVFLCLSFSLDSCPPNSQAVPAQAEGSLLKSCRKPGPAPLWASAITTVWRSPTHSSHTPTPSPAQSAVLTPTLKPCPSEQN